MVPAPSCSASVTPAPPPRPPAASPAGAWQTHKPPRSVPQTAPGRRRCTAPAECTRGRQWRRASGLGQRRGRAATSVTALRSTCTCRRNCTQPNSRSISGAHPRHNADGGKAQQQARHHVRQIVPPGEARARSGSKQRPKAACRSAQEAGCRAAEQHSRPAPHPPPPFSAHPMAARLSASASAQAATPPHSQGRLRAQNSAAKSATNDALRRARARTRWARRSAQRKNAGQQAGAAGESSVCGGGSGDGGSLLGGQQRAPHRLLWPEGKEWWSTATMTVKSPASALYTGRGRRSAALRPPTWQREGWMALRQSTGSGVGPLWSSWHHAAAGAPAAARPL